MIHSTKMKRFLHLFGMRKATQITYATFAHHIEHKPIRCKGIIVLYIYTVKYRDRVRPYRGVIFFQYIITTLTVTMKNAKTILSPLRKSIICLTRQPLNSLQTLGANCTVCLATSCGNVGSSRRSFNSPCQIGVVVVGGPQP